MKTLLIITTGLSCIAAIFCTFCVIALFRSEKKLAKYGESVLFKRKNDNEQEK